MKKYTNKETSEVVDAKQFTNENKHGFRHYCKWASFDLDENRQPCIRIYIDDDFNCQTLKFSDWFVKPEGNLYGFVISNQEFIKKYESL